MRITLPEVYAEFAAALGVPCCIAGGAVRDHLLGRPPKDWDVFVFGKYDRKRLGAYDVQPITANSGYAGFHVVNIRWRGEAIQIVGPKRFRSVDALLDTFDWNICGFAYDGCKTFQRMDTADIGPGKTLRLLTRKTPAASLRRGFRFSERFGMNIHPNDLAKLCRLTAEGIYRGTAAAA